MAGKDGCLYEIKYQVSVDICNQDVANITEFCIYTSSFNLIASVSLSASLISFVLLCIIMLVIFH